MIRGNSWVWPNWVTETQPSATGVVLHVYQRAGKPEYGSFALEDEGTESFRDNAAWRAET